MSADRPLCSVTIPCRNEEKNITKCLDAILFNDYPKDKLEIFIVDGLSNDNTREVVKKYIKLHPDIVIRMIENYKKITPSGINLGIKHSRGSVISIIGAHNYISQNYLSTAIKYIEEDKADCVGGIGLCVSINHTILAEAISLALKSKFGVGISFRTKDKTQYVDTVPSPVYKKEIFNKIYIFNEDLVRNQDIEFNSRLKKSGGNILLVSDIVSYYHARSNLKDLWIQNFRNGYWNIKTVKIAPGSLSLRHFVPLFFVLSLLITWPIFALWLSIAMSYIFCNIFFSLKVALKNGFRYLFVMPIIFFTLHLSYGFGSLMGILAYVAKINKKGDTGSIP